jgi:hypothetical protein
VTGSRGEALVISGFSFVVVTGSNVIVDGVFDAFAKGQLEPPNRPTRVRARDPVGDIVRPHHREGLLDSLAPLGSRYVEQPCEPGDVLPAGQRRLDRRLLRHVADQAAHRHRRSPDIVAEDRDTALLHGQQGVEDPDRRRLAGVVRAEQAEHLADMHCQLDPGERLVVAEPMAEPRRTSAS